MRLLIMTDCDGHYCLGATTLRHVDADLLSALTELLRGGSLKRVVGVADTAADLPVDDADRSITLALMDAYETQRVLPAALKTLRFAYPQYDRSVDLIGALLDRCTFLAELAPAAE